MTRASSASEVLSGSFFESFFFNTVIYYILHNELEIYKDRFGFLSNEVKDGPNFEVKTSAKPMLFLAAIREVMKINTFNEQKRQLIFKVNIIYKFIGGISMILANSMC